MVGVSASVNLPLHHKVQKFSSGTSSPGWSQKKCRKTVVVWWVVFSLKKRAFSALRLLVDIRKSIRPVKIEYRDAGVVICMMCRSFVYGPADATATP